MSRNSSRCTGLTERLPALAAPLIKERCSGLSEHAPQIGRVTAMALVIVRHKVKDYVRSPVTVGMCCKTRLDLGCSIPGLGKAYFRTR